MSELLYELKRINWRAVTALWLLALVIYLGVAIPTWQAEKTLGSPMLISGYSLFACIVFLAAFKVRKHVSMLPLLPARYWFAMHSMMGLLAIALYVLHVDKLWPESGYLQLLSALMIAVTITGIIGYLLEKVFPGRLTQTNRLTHKGAEVIYEKIPDTCYQIRKEAEKILFEQIKDTGSDTLSRYYIESLDWFFHKPRFSWSHISGSRKANYWLKQQFVIVNRYLNDSEKIYSQQLEILAFKKHDIDYQYAVQALLKRWLLVHVPLSAMLLVMSLWHLLLVNIYSV